MKGFLIGIAITFGVFIFVGLPLFFGATPTGKAMWNTWFHAVQVADDNTNYETLQEVENTARAMIASYNADKMIWLQYKDSLVTEEISWANNAKIRANQTASSYNNYILLNSYVWRNNVPSDIYMTLPYLQ